MRAGSFAYRSGRRGRGLALLALIAALALLCVLGPVLQDTVRMDMPTTYLTLVPIASLLVGYTLYRWHGQVFEWVGWGNVLGALGLLKEIGRLVEGGADLGDLSMKMMSVVVGVLSLYLARKVFTKPQEVKDPLGQLPTRYLFREEGME